MHNGGMAGFIMNCKLSGDYTMKYFDGSLNDIENAQLKQHLKACKKCNVEFKNMDEIVTFLKTSGTVEPPECFVEDVMKKVSSIEALSRKRADRWLILLYNFTTAVFVVLLTIFTIGLKEASISGLFEQAGKAFSSFSSAAFGLRSIIIEAYNVVTGLAGTLLNTAVIICKEYYHVFIILLSILVAIQKTLIVLVKQDKGES